MDGVNYIRVCEEGDENIIEIPMESDGTVLLTTLNGVFPKATGLKHLAPDSGCFRGVRLADGKLFPPLDGWIHIYCCVLPKDNKRKIDEEQFLSSKSKKIEEKKSTDLIVLNLAWKTDESLLREYFSKYGDLITVQVKRHLQTQLSKGYGFIRFSDYTSQILCLAERHNIDGRWCDLEGDRQEVCRKIHVGGITEHLTNKILRDYFSQFGVVTDVFIPKPFRSFAFVSFDDPEIATEILGKDQIIDGIKVSIGSAVPRLSSNSDRHNSGLYPEIQYPTMDNSWGKMFLLSNFLGWPYSVPINNSNTCNINSALYDYYFSTRV